jgi:hypothetical protein
MTMETYYGNLPKKALQKYHEINESNSIMRVRVYLQPS